MLNLFIGGIGACSLAPHIALEEAGADYKITKLDFKAGEQRGADYLKINPKGRAPALVTDKGTITENPAILFYIGQTYSNANLLPQDSFDVARMQDFNSFLCSTVHPQHAHGMRGTRWSDDPAIVEGMKVKVSQNMHDSFALIEKDYFKGPWLLGDQFTTADIYLYTLATWLEGDKVDMGAFPKVKHHREIMSTRPAVQKVRATYA